MSSQRWQQVDQLLDSALEYPSGEREGWLADACGDDSELYHEVATLLDLDQEDGFLDRPAFSVHDDDPEIGRRIGAYRVLRRIGRGGMGTVYLAEREGEYSKQVALKLIKRGMDSGEIVRRFENERQILAALEHPNIARLLDGGTTDDGRPYFAMEYVEGTAIDRYCDEKRLSTRQRLLLFLDVCSAVQASHQSLVVHRDLKPGNILVDAREARPKLLDFGVAKLLDPGPAARSLATAHGRRPMTLRYASPEQIGGGAVTTASDVYALGVVLYELLTGHHPHDLSAAEPGDEELARRIRHDDPRRPSTAVRLERFHHHADGTVGRQKPAVLSDQRGSDPRRLQRRLRGDLDAVVLKALRKDPRRRFGSVEQFADDIRRHLDGRPVTARSPTAGYRAAKFLRRNPVAVAVFLLVLAFGLVSAYLWRQAVEERHQAREQQRRAERMTEALTHVLDSLDPDEAAGSVTLPYLLDSTRRDLVGELDDVPDLQAELLDVLGGIYYKMRLLSDAREIYRRSLDISQELLPHDEAKIAVRLNNLGSAEYQLGDLGQAEELFRRSQEIRHRLGLDGPEAVRTINNLATILMHRGAFDEAESLYREGLRIRLRHTGLEHQNVARSLHALANLRYVRGDYAQAEPLLVRALEILRASLGHRNTRVAGALEKLGNVELALGDLELTETRYFEALDIRLELLGEAHPLVARTRRNLAEVLLARGESATAGVLLDQAFRDLYAANRAKDWEIAEAEGLLGALRAVEDRPGEATVCLVDSYAVLARERGSRSTYACKALRRLLDHEPALVERYGAAITECPR